ncbi:4-hydroxy-tetrahydrodipicolinate synthase [Blastococcus colisei]|uniref:4-hydroxy-tetrahydrodipicolinate synthase n=1 Tax=Blastococcus colisei TaxID=1564162 RepID=A0A543PDC0_9ACTN|nr:dihydrodipicolinate synthase family protein [Blastococcus colisei]TQN42076.1 4-hydroxy-tetrahydrodipicolinate synthase [Blastococcus colisei]
MTRLADGVWGVVATPFSGSTLDVDEGSLVKLVSHYESIGVTGLTVLGVFGEAAQLSSTERRDVLEAVADTVDLPLVVGATALGTAPVIEEGLLAVEAVGSRIAGLMVQVNSPRPDVLAAHLRAVHEATGLPIVVQDYPAISGVSVSADVLAEVLADLPFVAAVKAEAPPTPPAIATLTARLDVPVFGGLGGIGLLDELAAGSAGAMTGFSYPEGLLACVRAFASGGYEAAREAFLPYLPLVNFEQQVRIALAVRKEALRRRGLIVESAARPPAAAFPASLSAQLDRHLAAVPALEGVS